MAKFEPVPHRFNFWIASTYYHDAPNIASRFWDLDPNCDWSLLACVWHTRNDFGRKIDPVFSVNEIFEASKKEGWLPGDVARVVHECWLGYVADKQRAQDAPIVILPPTPEPPKPVPPALPEIHLPQPKKNPNPAVVKFSVWFGILASIAGVVSWFVPVLKPWLLAIVPIVETILKMIGV